MRNTHSRRPTSFERAARLHAEANPADPFAYSRMLLHLENGLDDPDAVAKDAKRLLDAKRKATR